jgi:hypothetical protein
VGSVGARLADIPLFARKGAILLTSAVLPVGALSAPLQALVLIAAASIVGVALVRIRRHASRATQEWTWWAVVGGLGIGATYFMFLGSQLHPLDPGIDNRTNVFAGLAYSVLVYALIATAASLLFTSRRSASAASISAVALIAVGYAVHLRSDEAAWKRASVLQHVVLNAVLRELPRLPHGSTVLTFGHSAQTAPEVPVFDKEYDLTGALQLRTDDPTLQAYPIFHGVSVQCESTGVVIGGSAGYGRFNARYRFLYFLDVGARAAMPIPSRLICEQALPGFSRRRYTAATLGSPERK